MKDASRGMKIATEFVCAVFIGAFLGWMIDSLFNTLPWFMLLFFCLGTVAGFMNAYRAAIGAEDDKFAGYRVFQLNSRTKDKKQTSGANAATEDTGDAAQASDSKPAAAASRAQPQKDGE